MNGNVCRMYLKNCKDKLWEAEKVCYESFDLHYIKHTVYFEQHTCIDGKLIDKIANRKLWEAE